MTNATVMKTWWLLFCHLKKSKFLKRPLEWTEWALLPTIEREEMVHFYLFRSIDYWENGKMTTKSEGREKAWQVLMPVLSIAFSKNRSRPSQTTKGKYLNMCTPVWNSQFFYWILYTNKLTTPASLSSVVQCSCKKDYHSHDCHSGVINFIIICVEILAWSSYFLV